MNSKINRLSADALEDFRKKYPSHTSADLQTFVLGLTAGLKININSKDINDIGLSPCECVSTKQISLLKEVKSEYNDDAISMDEQTVILKFNHTLINIPRTVFKKFSEWFLTKQII